MEIKNCQMIIAQDYLEALKRCNVEDNIRISQQTIDEEQLIKHDLTRSSLICPTKAFKDLEHIWLNEYKQKDGNEYHQGRIEGGIIPCTKITQFMMLFNGFAVNVMHTEKISFSYFDDNNRLCGFTLAVLLDCPSIWFASVTINTTASAKDRQVMVFVPQFSRDRFENNTHVTNTLDRVSKDKKEGFYQGINEIMQLVNPIMLPMNLLSGRIGNALNCHFIEYYLTGLFDEQGFIRIEQCERLKHSIKNQANMFDFSIETTHVSNQANASVSEKTTALGKHKLTSYFFADKSPNPKLINQNLSWATKNLNVLQGLIEFVEDLEEQKNLKEQIDAAIFVLDFNLGIKDVIEEAIKKRAGNQSEEKIIETLLKNTSKEDNKEKLLSYIDAAILDLLNAKCKLGHYVLILKDKLTSETIVNTMHQ